jgi:hypothetical protein
MKAPDFACAASVGGGLGGVEESLNWNNVCLDPNPICINF